MDDHFDTSSVFEISKFDISKFACIVPFQWKIQRGCMGFLFTDPSLSQNYFFFMGNFKKTYMKSTKRTPFVDLNPISIYPKSGPALQSPSIFLSSYLNEN